MLLCILSGFIAFHWLGFISMILLYHFNNGVVFISALPVYRSVCILNWDIFLYIQIISSYWTLSSCAIYLIRNSFPRVIICPAELEKGTGTETDTCLPSRTCNSSIGYFRSQKMSGGQDWTLLLSYAEVLIKIRAPHAWYLKKNLFGSWFTQLSFLWIHQNSLHDQLYSLIYACIVKYDMNCSAFFI